MFPRHSFYTIVIHRQKKKVKKCTNSPFAGLDESGVQCQSFSKVYEFLSKQNIPAGMKDPDRKAGPIYTKFKIVYAVRRCVPWKRKIWTGPI